MDTTDTCSKLSKVMTISAVVSARLSTTSDLHCSSLDFKIDYIRIFLSSHLLHFTCHYQLESLLDQLSEPERIWLRYIPITIFTTRMKGERYLELSIPEQGDFWRALQGFEP